MEKEIIVNPPFIKLDAFLKFAGAFITGGTAKEEIIGGKVKVNGEICTMRGKKLVNNDRVEYENEAYMVKIIEGNESKA